MADVDTPKFDVSVVTPDGPVFQGEAGMLIVPGAAGEIGVLARHAPLVATLKAGSTRVHLGGNEVLEFATGPGFFKVETDRALALVDDAVSVTEIDDARAQAQLDEARAELEKVEAGESRPIGGSSSSESSTPRTSSRSPGARPVELTRAPSQALRFRRALSYAGRHSGQL